MKKFKAYIFDLDGTILDSTPINIESFLYSCRVHLGKEVTLNEFRKLFGRPLLEQMQHYSKEKAQDMVETYRTYMDKIHDEKVKLFPGSIEVLKMLKENNIKCALVTSKARSFAQRALNLFDIDKYFDVKVFHEDCTNHKPHPEPYLLAIDKMGFPSYEILSIGDSPYDVIASREAGLKTAVVDWSDFSKEDIEKVKPDYIIHDLKEIL
ncbi:MAG: pyrophosphatase PpaX [Clostridia bacterium]|jgi:pyrophosphatase PpaX|nr:Gph [Clostridiales bacterium]MDK2985201.1 pyrophosphatase PpaX [Clostridia bacterium]